LALCLLDEMKVVALDRLVVGVGAGISGRPVFVQVRWARRRRPLLNHRRLRSRTVERTVDRSLRLTLRTLDHDGCAVLFHGIVEIRLNLTRRLKHFVELGLQLFVAADQAFHSIEQGGVGPGEKLVGIVSIS